MKRATFKQLHEAVHAHDRPVIEMLSGKAAKKQRRKLMVARLKEMGSGHLRPHHRHA